MLALSATAGGWGGIAAWDVVEPLNREAIQLASALDDAHVLGEVLNYDASFALAFGKQPRAMDSGLQSGDLLLSLGDYWKACESYAFGLWALIELGRFDAVNARATELHELGSRWGARVAMSVANWAQAMVSLAIDGDLEQWEVAARRALELPIALDAEPIALPWLALARFARGDWDAALHLAAQGARHKLTNRVHGMETGPLLQVRAYVGDRDGALEILDRERDYLPQAGSSNGSGAWQLLGYAVEGLTMLRARHECAALYPAAAEFAASGVVLTVHQGRLTQRVAGMAAATAGRWAEAEAHFAVAVHQAEKLPHRFEMAETHRFLAMMLIDRNGPGDRERAEQSLALAESRYRGMGAPRHAELVARLAADR